MSESFPLWHLATEFRRGNMSSHVPAILHFVFVTLVTSHLLNMGCDGSRHYPSPGRVVLYRSVATTSSDSNNQRRNWDDRPIRWPDRRHPEPHKYALHNRDDGILFRWNYNDNRAIHSTAIRGENHQYSTPFLSYTEYEQTNARPPTVHPVNSEHSFGNPQITGHPVNSEYSFGNPQITVHPVNSEHNFGNPQIVHLHHHHHYYDTSVNPLNANFWQRENLSQPIEPEILYKHILQISKSHHENNQQSSNVALQTAAVMPRTKTNTTPEIPPFRPSPQLHQFSEPDPLFHPNKSVFLTHPTPTVTESTGSITSTTEKPTAIKIYPDSINAQLPPSDSHTDTIIPYVSAAAAATASKASATSTTQVIPYMSTKESYVKDALSTTMQSTVETTTTQNDVMEHMLMFQPHVIKALSALSSESLSPPYSNNSDSPLQVAMPTSSSAIQVNTQQQQNITQNDDTHTQDDTDLPVGVAALSHTESDTSASKSDNVSVINNSEKYDNPKGSDNSITILSKVNKESGNVTIPTKVNMQSTAVPVENVPHIIQKNDSFLKVRSDFNSTSHVDRDVGRRKPAETIFIAPQMPYQHGKEIAYQSTETNEDLTTLYPNLTDY